MKRLSVKQKKWINAKSRKAMHRLSKRKKKKSKRKRHKQYGNSDNFTKTHYLCAPTTLSLNDNEQETIDFFKRALDVGEQCSVKHRIYFDLKNVENITADAVMYIIAFINNFKRLKILNVYIEGNLPQNDNARFFLQDVGFYSYVKGLKKIDLPNTNRFQISHGQIADGELVGKICDFINSIMGKTDLLCTKRLYPMIIELMTNTRQHAYNRNNKSSIMECNWYVFAENSDNCIKFIFLDTGVGIPETLSYNFPEKIANLFSGQKRDASFISSALKGDFRTETRERNRGKGLPGIYRDSINGRITNMSIISGSGKCIIMSDGQIEEKNLSSHFEGTLFCWEYSIK